MIELYQAEWCPHSHRVRQRLTELDLDFMAHQVPVPAERTGMERATARRSIPTLVLDDGSIVSGDDEILAVLDRRFTETSEAERHRAKAAEEWPEWLRLAPARTDRFVGSCAIGGPEHREKERSKWLSS
jgi:glutaredoxin 3